MHRRIDAFFFYTMQTTDWRLGEITGAIIKSFYFVYDALGPGFLESVYRKALQYELQDLGLHVETEIPITVWLKGRKVGRFRADLIVNGSVIVEVKASRIICDEDRAQLQNYLRATNLEIGLLLNFGPKPDIRRLEIENSKKPSLGAE